MFHLHRQSGSAHHIEDSVAIRIISSAMSIVGALAASDVADTPLWLICLAIAGIVVGSQLSYRNRYKKNIAAKIWISVGIIVVAAVFFKELLVRLNLSVADARIPLTNMLIALQSLHCFDLPRRRDLSLSAIVGLTLLSSAATLSHDMRFAIYLFIFLALGILLMRFDCISRTRTRAQEQCAFRSPAVTGTTDSTALQQVPSAIKRSIKSQAIVALLGFLAFCLTSVGLFAIMPRADITLLRHVRVSGGLDLSFLHDPSISPFLKGVAGDGSIKKSPDAYYGFAETLDTNYRGHLSNEIVLRVASPVGTYWRGMAYDTFDGRTWSMSDPRPSASRMCRDGLVIDLAPVPGLDVSRRSLGAGTATGTRELTQVFYVEANSSNLVVCAPVPYQIYFPSPLLLLDRYGAIRSPVGVEREMVYTVISRLPYRSKNVMRRIELTEEEHAHLIKHMANYLQLPMVNPTVAELAAKVATGKTWYLQAEQLCKHLQTCYRYNLDLPPSSGKDSVSEFITSRTGFCEQFATTFCIMCRMRGIPARLVTGYTPGSYNALTGMWDVRLSDAHSWAEVFIPHAGWTAFDPTPEAVYGGFEGIEQGSTWTFFASESEKIFSYWARQPAVLSAVAETGKALANLNSFLPTTGKVWPWVVTAGAASILALWGTRLFNRGNAQRTEVERRRAIAEAAANVSMRKVLADLALLQVVRHPSDTLDDILEKTKQSLNTDGKQVPPDSTSSAVAAASQQELSAKFLDELEGFFDDYATRRYGGKEGDNTLKELSESLHRMIGLLRKRE